MSNKRKTQLSLFHYPGLFTAWGLKNKQWTPEQLVDKAATSGFKWICQSVNEFASPTITQRLREACHLRGLHFGIWEVDPKTLANVDAIKPNFWVLNAEHHGIWYKKLLEQFRSKDNYPLLPAAVITNCDFDPRPFISANVKIIPEAYLLDNPQATPANMEFRAHQLGYKISFPCLGVYGGFPLSGYTRAGQGYSIYLAEEMQDADWQTAKEWNTKP